jgi:hypothetical protein
LRTTRSGNQSGREIPSRITALLGWSDVSRSSRSWLAVAAGSGEKGTGSDGSKGGDFDEFHVFGIDGVGFMNLIATAKRPADSNDE